MLLISILLIFVQNIDPYQKSQTDEIVGQIFELESNRDPKCHATANRLETFIFGTPLTEKARFLKTEYQKGLLLEILSEAGEIQLKNPTKDLASILSPLFDQFLLIRVQDSGDFLVQLRNKSIVRLQKRDFDHYASVAYSLRAILALQQESMFLQGKAIPTLDDISVNLLKKFLDLYTLTALKISDTVIREQDRREIGPNTLKQAWGSLSEDPEATQHKYAVEWKRELDQKQKSGKPEHNFFTISRIIQQKLKSYEAYNQIAMPVFVRNLQVYFAKHRWPSNDAEARNYRKSFTALMTEFAFRSLDHAQKLAQKKGHVMIREEDVQATLEHILPFKVNNYEDIIFFPNGGKAQISIESYDCDSFRDTGIHWRYLEYAFQEKSEQIIIEPDPFAAELLVEGISQYGVLILRLSGLKAKEKNSEFLKAEHLKLAVEDVQTRLTSYRENPIKEPGDVSLRSSSDEAGKKDKQAFFSDVTEQSGIHFTHRSSDWLSRLLRSYIVKNHDLATLAIPPAFGGSGLAAGDLNQDGFKDILLLSGSGNRVFFSKGDGTFSMGPKSLFNPKRPDGTFSEPRQPLIADFDNDGRDDVFISFVKANHGLWKNLGNGQFIDVSKKSNLGGENDVAGPAVTFDYNQDGLLDIYIGNFGDFPNGQLPNLKRDNMNGLPNRLFENQGGMVFIEVSQKAGVGHTGWTQALGHTDINLDGRQDLIVGNDFGMNAWLIAQPDGTFQDEAESFGIRKPSSSMNVGIADLNRDGYPDIYISNIVTMVKDEKYVLPNENTTMKFNPEKLKNMRVIEANDLFISQKGETLTYQLSNAVGRGFSSTGWSWGAVFFDFDNDGDDDLYCVNGMNGYAVYSNQPYYTDVFDSHLEVQVQAFEEEPNVFFVNDGGKLRNYSKQSNLDLMGNSRSIVYLDMDRDGDLDIVLNNFHGDAHVFRNNNKNKQFCWLFIRLEGNPDVGSNRNAIGAKIQAFDTEGNQLAWREIHGGHGYLSMDSSSGHLGLGKHRKVDLTITWPNGAVQKYNGVKTNRRYSLQQKNGELIEDI